MIFQFSGHLKFSCGHDTFTFFPALLEKMVFIHQCYLLLSYFINFDVNFNLMHSVEAEYK